MWRDTNKNDPIDIEEVEKESKGGKFYKLFAIIYHTKDFSTGEAKDRILRLMRREFEMVIEKGAALLGWKIVK